MGRNVESWFFTKAYRSPRLAMHLWWEKLLRSPFFSCSRSPRFLPGQRWMGNRMLPTPLLYPRWRNGLVHPFLDIQVYLFFRWWWSDLESALCLAQFKNFASIHQHYMFFYFSRSKQAPLFSVYSSTPYCHSLQAFIESHRNGTVLRTRGADGAS